MTIMYNDKGKTDEREDKLSLLCFHYGIWIKLDRRVKAEGCYHIVKTPTMGENWKSFEPFIIKHY